MFDYFRDVLQEFGGIDTKKAKILRNEQTRTEKLSRYIFTAKLKRLVIVVGVVYLVLSVFMIVGLLNIGHTAGIALQVIKYIFLILIDITVILSLFNGTKKGEIVALVGCFAFTLLLYASFFIK